MQRRLAMISAGAAAPAAATTVGAWAQGKPKPATGRGHHHGQGKYAAVMISAMHCVTAVGICLDHCHVAPCEGDKSLPASGRLVPGAQQRHGTPTGNPDETTVSRNPIMLAPECTFVSRHVPLMTAVDWLNCR